MSTKIHHTFPNLSGGVSPVEVGEENFAESSLAEQLVRDDHVVLRDFDLVKLAPTPRGASVRQKFRPSLRDGPLTRATKRPIEPIPHGQVLSPETTKEGSERPYLQLNHLTSAKRPLSNE